MKLSAADRLSALCLTLPLASCTLIGLDDVQAEPCLVSPTANTDFTQANELCSRELSPLQPPGDCEAWVCGLRVGEEVFCTLAAPDVDGDGVGDARCIDDADIPKDCDDSDRNAGEGLAERCDGTDNDCDGVVDEDLLTRSAVARVAEATGAAGQVSFAESEGNIAALLRREVAGQQALWDWRSGGGTVPERVGAFTLYDPIAASDDPGLAVGFAGSATVGVFARNIAGCPRTLVAARVQNSGAASDVLDVGLPDLAGSDCGTMPARSEEQRDPAVAVVGSQALVVWTANRAGSASLRAVGGRLGTDLAVGRPAVDLGEIGSGTQAAVIGLPSVEAFILAIPRPTGVEIRTATLDSSLEISLSDPLTLPAGADLSLSRGVETEMSVAIAVAYRSGEGVQGRISLQRVTVPKNTLVPEAAGDPTPVDDGSAGQRRPSVAWGESPRGWLVAWVEDNSELRVQLLGENADAAGTSLGVFSSVDVAGDGLELRFGQAVTAGSDGGFSLATHATTTSGSLDGLHEVTLTCGGAPSG